MANIKLAIIMLLLLFPAIELSRVLSAWDMEKFKLYNSCLLWNSYDLTNRKPDSIGYWALTVVFLMSIIPLFAGGYDSCFTYYRALSPIICVWSWLMFADGLDLYTTWRSFKVYACPVIGVVTILGIWFNVTFLFNALMK